MENQFDIALGRHQNNIVEIQVKNRNGHLNLVTGEAEISGYIPAKALPQGKIKHITNFVVSQDALKNINEIVTQK